MLVLAVLIDLSFILVLLSWCVEPATSGFELADLHVHLRSHEDLSITIVQDPANCLYYSIEER